MVKPVDFPPAPPPKSGGGGAGYVPLPMYPSTRSGQERAVQAVDFNHIVRPRPPSNPKPVSVEPVSVFSTSLPSPVVKQAMARAKADYPDLLKAHGLEIQRQISQLIPLSLSVIMDWSSVTMSKFLAVSSGTNKLVRAISDSNGMDTIESALRCVQQPASRSVFSKFMKTASIEDYIPPLTVLKSQLKDWLITCIKLIETGGEIQIRLNIKLLSISTVAECHPISPDDSINVALSNKRLVCQQNVQQTQLTMMQLQQIKTQLVDQSSRVDQILSVTIPAYQAANN